MSEHDDASEYRGPTVPAELGERLQAAMGLQERPEDLGDWVAAMERIVEREGMTADLDALCTTEESPHRATFDGEVEHYQCAQDAFVVPFLAEDVDEVVLETESPVSGTPVEVTVTESDVDVDPPDAVLSIGVAVDAPAASEGDGETALPYETVCPYGHAFADRAEYEEWAADVDAVTTTMSGEETLALARALGGIA